MGTQQWLIENRFLDMVDSTAASSYDNISITRSWNHVLLNWDFLCAWDFLESFCQQEEFIMFLMWLNN